MRHLFGEANAAGWKFVRGGKLTVYLRPFPEIVNVPTDEFNVPVVKSYNHTNFSCFSILVLCRIPGIPNFLYVAITERPFCKFNVIVTDRKLLFSGEAAEVGVF